MKLFNLNKYFASEEEMTTDPVCHMRVLRNENLIVNFGGQAFYFCSEGCQKEFSSNPGKFV